MQPATHSGRTAAKAVIFDLDGVLVWSVPMHHWAFHKTFAAEGRDFPLDEYLRFAIGAPREVVIRTVMGELPAPEMKRLMDEKERYVRIYLDERGLDAIPGALQFVHEARQRALKTAVASASRTPEIILDAIAARASSTRSWAEVASLARSRTPTSTSSRPRRSAWRRKTASSSRTLPSASKRRAPPACA
jgi:beta-phosphoglucomutase-like phosphatase (HAD superfamily)